MLRRTDGRRLDLVREANIPTAITIRPALAADAAACGAILYRAFQALAQSHNFPPDFPSVDVATGLLSMLLASPGFYAVVAEDEGGIVGSNFAVQPSQIAGIGPISVDPMVQKTRALAAA